MDYQKKCKSVVKSIDWSQWIYRNLLLITTIAGVVVGTACGFLLRRFPWSEEQILIISFPGELFLRVFQMLMLPMLVSSTITVASDFGGRKCGKIVGRTIACFCIMSLVSTIAGLLVAMAFKPGAMLATNAARKPIMADTSLTDNFLDLGRNLIPDNLLQAAFQTTRTTFVNATDDNGPHVVRKIALSNGPNTLGIVIFCMVLGMVIDSIGPKGQVLKAFFSAMNDAMLALMEKAMWFNGIGVCSIICGSLLVIHDIQQVMAQLAYYTLTAMAALFVHQAVVLPMVYFVVVRRNPYTFLFGLAEPWLMAFTINSSVVTMPTSINCLVNDLKHNERIAKFVISLGVVLQYNGAAIMMAVATVFVTRLNGIDLPWNSLCLLVVMMTISSMTMPHVPSSSLFMVIVLLTTINVDPANVSILFAVEWILERFRTTSNMLDDCFAVAIVEELSKKDLDFDDSKSLESEKMLHKTLLIV